ncbi:hypothetical protein ACFQ1R_03325 [Mariniflexile jejuense]|uniref:Lipoprotein n=1 Tax=Mariniflexile jejuense TaxID=1173582 RepID=A0ABW3JGA9_9FLAO
MKNFKVTFKTFFFTFLFVSNVLFLFCSKKATNDFKQKESIVFVTYISSDDFKNYVLLEESSGEIISSRNKELESEFEIEPFTINKSKWVSSSKLNDNQLSAYITNKLSAKQSRPLYDLFCNWKFHLS